MTDVSDHAIRRAGNRISFAARVHAAALFASLWAVGRAASDEDIALFGGEKRRPGCEYRLAVKHHDRFLIIRNKASGCYITLIRYGKRHE